MTSASNDTPPEGGIPEDDLASEERLLQPSDPEVAANRRRIAEFGRPRAPLEAPPVFGNPEDESFLRNPYVVAGLAVAGAIVLAVIYLVLFGSRGGPGNGDGVFIEPLTPQPGRGVSGQIIATTTVRVGPSREFDAVGELTRGQNVEVAGRNEDSTWFAIYFPGSELRGWVPGSALKLPGENSVIPVVSVTPISRPTVILPTPTLEPTGTATATPTATGTATPVVAVDLALVDFLPGSCASGNTMVVAVKNLGGAKIENRSVRVTVSEGGAVVVSVDSVISLLEPGQTMYLPTGYATRSRSIVNVSLLGSPPDVNPANNVKECVVSGAPPTSTPAGSTAVPPPIPTPAPTVSPTP